MAWNRTRGLFKSVVCGLGCAATVAGYIPFVVGAAFAVSMAGMTAGSGHILAAATIILASPAIFAGESVAGAIQFVTGREASLSNLGEGSNSIFKKLPAKQMELSQQKIPEVDKGKVISIKAPDAPNLHTKNNHQGIKR